MFLDFQVFIFNDSLEVPGAKLCASERRIICFIIVIRKTEINYPPVGTEIG